MSENKINYTMLKELRAKEQWVLKTQRETGGNFTAAIDEVRRQIKQVMSGEQVTKSDGSFGND